MNEDNDFDETVQTEVVEEEKTGMNNNDLHDEQSNEERGEAAIHAAQVATQATDDKVTELTADLQRTRADFENFRRQAEAQKIQYGNVVKNTTVAKILPLLDDIDRAIAVNENLKPLEKSLAKALKELKLERVESKAGTAFDPDLHDAVMVEGDGDKEVVAETLRAGYRYEGELIRPALVKVEKQ
ncbi:MAG: nucleotide exchange factor GrpE [Candidatus Saccharibacteria bacterium]|nr:nucleotide exchange factor GrpE [Candidatus Saccharibacteria bacterium]